MAVQVPCTALEEGYGFGVKPYKIIEYMRELPSEERRVLVEQIWDEFADGDLAMSREQVAELKHRVEEHQERPDEVVPWEKVKAEALQKHRPKQ